MAAPTRKVAAESEAEIFPPLIKSANSVVKRRESIEAKVIASAKPAGVRSKFRV
jgi:hypothetical protein